MDKTKEELFENILKSLKEKSGNRKRPTPLRSGMKKNRSGVFTKYYGTKFFCTSTGAVYTLQERDPETGLNVLRVNRHVVERILRFDRKFVMHGVVPHSVGDVYLSDAETVLLLREYPLPHLGIELRLITRENIDNALKKIDEACDALRDEIYIRSYNRKFIYRLGWMSEARVQTKTIKVKDIPEFPNVRAAVEGMHKDKAKLEELLGVGKTETKYVPTGRPAGRPKRVNAKPRKKYPVKKEEPTQDP